MQDHGALRYTEHTPAPAHLGRLRGPRAVQSWRRREQVVSGTTWMGRPRTGKGTACPVRLQSLMAPRAGGCEAAALALGGREPQDRVLARGEACWQSSGQPPRLVAFAAVPCRGRLAPSVEEHEDLSPSRESHSCHTVTDAFVLGGLNWGRDPLAAALDPGQNGLRRELGCSLLQMLSE